MEKVRALRDKYPDLQIEVCNSRDTALPSLRQALPRKVQIRRLGGISG